MPKEPPPDAPPFPPVPGVPPAPPPPPPPPTVELFCVEAPPPAPPPPPPEPMSPLPPSSPSWPTQVGPARSNAAAPPAPAAPNAPGCPLGGAVGAGSGVRRRDRHMVERHTGANEAYAIDAPVNLWRSCSRQSDELHDDEVHVGREHRLRRADDHDALCRRPLPPCVVAAVDRDVIGESEAAADLVPPDHRVDALPFASRQRNGGLQRAQRPRAGTGRGIVTGRRDEDG